MQLTAIEKELENALIEYQKQNDMSLGVALDSSTDKEQVTDSAMGGFSEDFILKLASANPELAEKILMKQLANQRKNTA